MNIAEAIRAMEHGKAVSCAPENFLWYLEDRVIYEITIDYVDGSPIFSEPQLASGSDGGYEPSTLYNLLKAADWIVVEKAPIK